MMKPQKRFRRKRRYLIVFGLLHCQQRPTREKLGDLAKSDEDVLSYIAFPNLAEKFLEERKAKEENVVTYSIVEC